MPSFTTASGGMLGEGGGDPAERLPPRKKRTHEEAALSEETMPTGAAATISSCVNGVASFTTTPRQNPEEENADGSGRRGGTKKEGGTAEKKVILETGDHERTGVESVQSCGHHQGVDVEKMTSADDGDLHHAYTRYDFGKTFSEEKNDDHHEVAINTTAVEDHDAGIINQYRKIKVIYHKFNCCFFYSRCFCSSSSCFRLLFVILLPSIVCVLKSVISRPHSRFSSI
jgi:hypothetical protein